jgi:hypothetical protein
LFLWENGEGSSLGGWLQGVIAGGLAGRVHRFAFIAWGWLGGFIAWGLALGVHRLAPFTPWNSAACVPRGSSLRSSSAACSSLGDGFGGSSLGYWRGGFIAAQFTPWNSGACVPRGSSAGAVHRWRGGFRGSSLGGGGRTSGFLSEKKKVTHFFEQSRKPSNISRLETRSSRLEARSSKLETRSSKLTTRHSQL